MGLPNWLCANIIWSHISLMDAGPGFGWPCAACGGQHPVVCDRLFVPAAGSRGHPDIYPHQQEESMYSSPLRLSVGACFGLAALALAGCGQSNQEAAVSAAVE